MPTLKQVQAETDNWINTFWPKLQAQQAIYKKGRYFQGLETTLPLPSYSALVNDEKKPNRLNIKPTDRTDTWNMFDVSLFEDIKIPPSVRCDEYLGPLGKGYCLVVSFLYNDGLSSLPDLWVKTLQNGPETHRAHDWIKVEQDA